MENFIVKFRNLGFLLLFFSCDGQSQKTNSVDIAGDYDNILHIAISEKDSRLSGFISYAPYENDPKLIQIECKIFFEATFNKNLKNDYLNINIYSLNTDSFYKKEGEIKIDSNKIFLKIKNNIPSCSSVLDFTDKKGALFYLTKKVRYNNFNFIKTDKAIIYQKPEDGYKTKKYLIKGDVVNVLKSEGEFILVEFYGQKVTKGWIHSNELFF